MTDTRKKTLVGVVGAAAAALLTTTVMQWEGRELRAYRDVVGVWTICDGDTADVRPGQTATKAECDARLERQLIAHAEPVLRCVPGLKGRDYQLAAAASLAYNIGPVAFCRSTAARRFNAGDWRGGCEAFMLQNRATYAKPKSGGNCKLRRDGRWSCEVRGLTNRRKAEREICLRGLS